MSFSAGKVCMSMFDMTFAFEGDGLVPSPDDQMDWTRHRMIWKDVDGDGDLNAVTVRFHVDLFGNVRERKTSRSFSVEKSAGSKHLRDDRFVTGALNLCPLSRIRPDSHCSLYLFLFVADFTVSHVNSTRALHTLLLYKDKLRQYPETCWAKAHPQGRGRGTEEGGEGKRGSHYIPKTR